MEPGIVDNTADGTMLGIEVGATDGTADHTVIAWHAT